MSLLIRLSTDKYPPGTPNRWELMARQLNRAPEDVTIMAGKIKNMKQVCSPLIKKRISIQEEYSKLLRGQQSSAVNESAASEQKPAEWQQNEQKQFEAALQLYPKGTEERFASFISKTKHIVQMGKDSRVSPGKDKRTVHSPFQRVSRIDKKKKSGYIILLLLACDILGCFFISLAIIRVQNIYYFIVIISTFFYLSLKG